MFAKVGIIPKLKFWCGSELQLKQCAAGLTTLCHNFILGVSYLQTNVCWEVHGSARASAAVPGTYTATETWLDIVQSNRMLCDWILQCKIDRSIAPLEIHECVQTEGHSVLLIKSLKDKRYHDHKIVTHGGKSQVSNACLSRAMCSHCRASHCNPRFVSCTAKDDVSQIRQDRVHAHAVPMFGPTGLCQFEASCGLASPASRGVQGGSGTVGQTTQIAVYAILVMLTNRHLHLPAYILSC
jgi:hypothetical protein